MKKYKFRKTFTFDGKRYEAYGNTEKEALMNMFSKKRDLEEGRVVITGSMTVSEWTKIALETYKGNVSDVVMKDMQYRIDSHILKVIGSYQIKSIKPIQCQAILNAQAGKSFSHVQKVTQELKFIFETALNNKLILENPAANVVKPKAVKGKRQALSDYERDIFEKVTSRTNKFRIFELMIYCGCRPAEAIKCQGTDIAIKKGIPILHIRGTKTENSDRFVPIPEQFYDKIKNTEPFKPIAPNSRNNSHSESSYDRATASLKREMNIAMGCKVYRNQLIPPLPLRDSFVPYELRHTYCTDLAKRKVDIRVAQKLMGHASITITADIYTHVEENQILDDAFQILGAIQNDDKKNVVDK